MVILEHDLPADHQVIYTSCWHEGSELKYQKVIDQIINEVLTVKNTFWLHHGDWAEALTIDDPRYVPEADKGWTPFQQYQELRRMIKPIRKKCLAALYGNHDKRFLRWGNMVRDYLCADLDENIPIPYGTYAAKIIIKNKGCPSYKIYATHGRRSITSAADDPGRRLVNQQLILKRHLREQAGDCLFQVKGHNHKLITLLPSEMLYLTDDGHQMRQNYTGEGRLSAGYIHQDFRYYGCAGSAYRLFADPEKGISSYAEEGEYPPVELGYLRATVRGPRVEAFERVVVE